MADRKVKWSAEMDVNDMLASIKKMAEEYQKAGKTGQQAGKQLEMSASEIRQKIKALATEIDGLKDVDAIRAKQAEMKGYEDALDKVIGKQKKFDDVPSGGGSRGVAAAAGKGAFLGTMAGTVAASALQALPGMIMDVGRAMIQGNAEMEQYQASFETMLGSAEAAKGLMGDLKKFGAETPFEFPGLAQNATLLKSFGMETEQIIPTLKMLGDVSGGSQEKLNGLALVFAQVRSAGKLQGQDLMQMINQGFNPLSQIAERTGKSMGQLKDEMSKGLITFDMVNQAFRDATSEGGQFYGMMEKQSKGFNGLLSTLKDNIGEMTRDVGAPLFDAAKGGLLYVMDVLQRPEVKKVIETLKDGFEDIKDKLDDPKIQKGLDLLVEALSWLAEQGIEVMVDTVSAFIDYQTSILEVADALGILDMSTKTNAREQLRANDAIMKGKEESLKYAQSTEKLVSEYEALATKSKRTTEEEERRREVLAQLQKDYPDIIRNTDDFAGSLEGVRSIGEQTSGQISKLNEDIKGLSASSRAAQLIILQGQIQDVKQGLVDLGWTWKGVNESTADLRGAKTMDELTRAMDRFNTASSETLAKARREGNEELANAIPKALEYGAKLFEIRRQMLELAGQTMTTEGDGGAGGEPPAPTGPDDKAKKAAFDAAMAELQRQQAIDEQKAKNAQATEQELFEIWESYQLKRLQAAERYGQDAADLENELSVRRLANEGRTEKELAALEQLRADAQQETNERRERETEQSIEYVTDLTEQAGDTSFKQAAADQDAIAQTAELRKQAVNETLANLSEATQEFFELNKGVAIAQATVNTYEGATKALATYPPPFGAIAMAAVIAAGLAQVTQIVKQKPTMLAEGGVLDRPTFVAGEAGAELVAPLEKGAEVIAEKVLTRLGFSANRQRRTRITQRSGTRVEVGITNRIVGRGSRASQIAATAGVF